jgi:hypothetical protein
MGESVRLATVKETQSAGKAFPGRPHRYGTASFVTIDPSGASPTLLLEEPDSLAHLAPFVDASCAVVG